ncbi:MAG TPA: hypothetical protein VIM04_01580 [Candidatus Binatia bacterium]|jgi:hypothetical protein
MVIRIASAVMSLAGLLALVSGLLFWTGTALDWIQLHMLLGFLTVGALWVVAIGQIFAKKGSWVVAAAAIIVGAATIVLGMTQASLMVGDFHWLVEVLHLALGIFTIGLGHIGAARYRKRQAE